MTATNMHSGCRLSLRGTRLVFDVYNRSYSNIIDQAHDGTYIIKDGSEIAQRMRAVLCPSCWAKDETRRQIHYEDKDKRLKQYGH